MIIDILNRMVIAGDLEKLMRAFPNKKTFETILKKRDVYLFFNKEMLISNDKPVSITYTSEQLNVSERYVYKAIELMETDVLEIEETENGIKKGII